MAERERGQERNGVRTGQRVRDLDGRELGRVTALYESAFAVSRGFPILFRRDVVARFDEIREVRGGELVLARSERDLLELARGGIPPSWKVPVAGPLPAAATPPEASLLAGGGAGRGVPGARGGGGAPPAGRGERRPALSDSSGSHVG
jgi:hypothetical protein